MDVYVGVCARKYNNTESVNLQFTNYNDFPFIMQSERRWTNVSGSTTRPQTLLYRFIVRVLYVSDVPIFLSFLSLTAMFLRFNQRIKQGIPARNHNLLPIS